MHRTPFAYADRLPAERSPARSLRVLVMLSWVAAIGLLLVGLFTSKVQAAADAFGDVKPYDDLLTEDIDEGIPVLGNFVDLNEAFDHQTHFEGWYHPGADLESPDDDMNMNTDIIVGEKAWGQLLISSFLSGVGLRFNHLIIGDSGTLRNGQTGYGNGTVVISGFNAVYNNNPYILPPAVEVIPNFSSVNPRENDPDHEEGFDLYVGRAGIGLLEINSSGRAEIEDAVIVGDQVNSLGTLRIDGVGSFLGSGGFDASGGTIGVVHRMVIGRYGQGTMSITNGGLVDIEAPLGEVGQGDDVVAAVIGGDPYDNQPPEVGGQGAVLVDGAASRWNLRGSLQIGGFHDAQTTAGNDDIEGDELEYISEAGRGTLTVTNGGLVSLRPTQDAVANDELNLLIGYFGTLRLDGGHVSVGSPGTRLDTMRLINDGVIEGTGRIDTGTFRNRLLGRVTMNAGDTLVIDASSEYKDTNDGEPLVNYGTIEVIGTADRRAELDIVRATDAITDPIRPFRNERVPRENAGDPSPAALIYAQHGTLRFRSGLENQGIMTFDAGHNVIQGDVINLGPAPDALPTVDEGRIFVLGDAVATFENDLTLMPGSGLLVDPGARLEVLAANSLVLAGTVTIGVRVLPTGIDVGRLTSAGDVGIAGELEIVVEGALNALSAGDEFEIITAGGQLGGVDFSDPLPKPDLTVAPLFTSLIMPDLSPVAADLVMVPRYTSSSVLLSVRSTAGFIGADFDGSGYVDLSDLAIWRANFGITMGATVLQGDADGDGDVDGDDYLEWLAQLGPVPGGGAGAIAGTAVPEPTSAGLLFWGGLLALAAAGRRRRARC